MIRDITEKHRLEQLKTEFISVVSHELRTPLTSIQVALSLLDAHLVEPNSADGRAMMMPGTDGVTAFQQMQANPQLRSIPTILLTAKAQTRERERFSQLAIAGIITKPFKAPDLIQQIQSILNWTD